MFVDGCIAKSDSLRLASAICLRGESLHILSVGNRMRFLVDNVTLAVVLLTAELPYDFAYRGALRCT